MSRQKKSTAPALPFIDAPAEYLTLDPNELVIGVNYGRGGLLDEAFEAGVEQKVNSIRTHGQLQPVLARRLEDGKVGLVDGFERAEACRRLGIPVKVKIDPTIDTDAKAKVAAVIAQQFDKPTVLQEALTVADFLADGMSKTEIAALFGRDNTNRVAQLEKLLTAGDDLKSMVHNGTVSLNAAVQVAGDADAEAKFIASVLAGGDKTAVGAAGSKNRGKAEGEGDKPGPRRNVKHITEFITAREEGLSESALAILQAVVKFLSGAKTDQGLLNACKKV